MQLKKSNEEAQKGRETTDEYAELAEKMAKLEQEEKSQLEELVQFKENDPEVLKQRRDQAMLALKGANRWTGIRKIKLKDPFF